MNPIIKVLILPEFSKWAFFDISFIKKLNRIEMGFSICKTVKNFTNSLESLGKEKLKLEKYKSFFSNFLYFCFISLLFVMYKIEKFISS
jgi:hypothetical protein